MKLTTTLAFALVALAGATSPDPENLDNVDHPDYLATIDLDEVEREELSGTELFPRKQVQVCEAAVFGSRPVWESTRNKDNFAESMATLIKSRSDKHNCGIIRGEIDEISFNYRATGKHCDTTAQSDTIQGALKKALRLPGKDSIYPTMCFRLSHKAGTWNGFLSVGPSKLFNKASPCDGSLRFDTCASGGKKDARGISDERETASFPDGWFAYDLSTFDNTTSVEKRTQDNVCAVALTYITNTLVSAAQIKNFAQGISAVMHKKSEKRDCAATDGRFGDIAFKYHSTGKDCHTTSELGTIEGAIYHQLMEVHPHSIPETECIRFDHDGTWRGWLLYGPAGKVDLTRYCGEMLNFGQCHKGGKKYDFN